MKWHNSLIIKSAVLIAGKIKADALLIHTDPLDNLIFDGRISKSTNLILMSKKKKIISEKPSAKSLEKLTKATISLPRFQATRLALIKIAMALGLSKEIIKPNNKLVFVVGGTDQGSLDLIQIVDTSKESEFITNKGGISKISENIPPEVFQSILSLTIELSDKGREGKNIGTIFVMGDHEKVMQLSKQMILNPFKGYDEDERNILSPALKETIRELSAMDGAFVIASDGTLLAAGRYLGAAANESNLPRGLGSRHIAAAGITGLTQAVAFVISESSGDIRIFKDGKIIMHIEKAASKR